MPRTVHRPTQANLGPTDICRWVHGGAVQQAVHRSSLFAASRLFLER